MATVHQTILALLIVYVNAAPNNVPALELDKVENKSPKLDQSSPVERVADLSKDDPNSTENQRQKRYYNYDRFGLPPPLPPQYPTYNRRDQSPDLGVYGIDDPLSQIHRKLQEITSVVRQPLPPPPPIPTHYPVFFPIPFLVPHYGCSCRPGSNTQSTTKPDAPGSTTTAPVDGGTTLPGVDNRIPEIEDERNWGVFINSTDEDYDEEDYKRPISFDPVVSNSSSSRPAPPVEHGSSQGRPGTDTDSPRTTTAPPGAGLAPSASESPTTCDSAVLSCCHQPRVTYECFSILGCPDPSVYGNPCAPTVVLSVIEKYQKFYGVKNSL